MHSVNMQSANIQNIHLSRWPSITLASSARAVGGKGCCGGIDQGSIAAGLRSRKGMLGGLCLADGIGSILPGARRNRSFSCVLLLTQESLHLPE